MICVASTDAQMYSHSVNAVVPDWNYIGLIKAYEYESGGFWQVPSDVELYSKIKTGNTVYMVKIWGKEYIASRNEKIFECRHSWVSSILPSVRIKDPSNSERTIGIIHAWSRTWKDNYVGDIDNSMLEELESEVGICWDELDEYGVVDDFNVCLRLLRKEADPILMDLERIDDIVLKIMDLVSPLRM